MRSCTASKFDNLLLGADPLRQNRAEIMNLFDLSEDVAVVIGATGVLGGALAEGLAEAGAKVAVMGRNAERGAARVKSIQGKRGRAEFFFADAVHRESLHTAHESIV